jgi:hemerythrin
MHWRPSFEIGIESIDLQHKKLFHMICDFKNAINKQNMFQQMGTTLKFIADYTQKHFKSEEKFMRANNYPGYANHKVMHAELIKQTSEILIKIRNDKHVAPSQLLDFLMRWLLDHILEEDLKIKKHLENTEQKKIQKRLDIDEQKDWLITEALNKVKNQYRKKAISKEAYAEKKNKILMKYIHFEEKADNREVNNRIRKITYFYENRLISMKEELQYKALLFKNINLSTELARRKNAESKLNYLKSLYLNDLISLEMYEELIKAFN